MTVFILELSVVLAALAVGARVGGPVPPGPG